MKYIGQDPAVLDNFVTAVASGAISSGDPCVVEADGDVAAVTTSGTGIPTDGTAVTLNTYTDYARGNVFHAGENVVIRNVSRSANSYYGEVQAFSTSGDTVTAGTAVVYSTSFVVYSRIAYDANAQKAVVFYGKNASPYSCFTVVISASGTTLTAGSEVTVDSGDSRPNGLAYDANAQKLLYFYSLASDFDARVRTGTVSGSSVTFGAINEFYTGTIYDKGGAIYLPTAQKTLFLTEDHNGNTIKAVVCTISGTSVSVGSVATLSLDLSSVFYEPSLAVDANDNVLFTLQTSSNIAKAQPISVSGTTVTFGTSVDLDVATCTSAAVVYDPDSAVFVVVYNDNPNAKGRAATFTISNNTATEVASGEWLSVRPNYLSGVYDTSADKSIFSWGVSSPGVAAFTTNALVQNLTAENFIGFADKDYADGADAVIQAKGAVNDKQTSLTAGQSYFVQTDGTIGTTADDPSVFAGTAVSATQLIVKG